MPEPGTLYGDTLPNHNEVDLVATAFVDALATSKLKKLSPYGNRLSAVSMMLTWANAPKNSLTKAREYTPQSYMQSLGLNMDDYVSLTSYTHHPFYKPFVIEVQDNWRWSLSYNLPIDELMEVFDYAIHNGYTIAWGSDVSETGFTRNGIAVMPDVKQAEDLWGSDAARWLGLSNNSKRAEIVKKLTSKPLPEVKVTQEMRQTAYDNWETTDDHGMQIYGIAKDQNGKEYYMVKNSLG